MSQKGPVDEATIESLRELMEEEFDELVESFIEDGQKLVDGIGSAAQNGDAAEINRIAHALKSSSANMGAFQLSDYARELESLGGAGTLDGAADLATKARDEFARVRESLAAQIQRA